MLKKIWRHLKKGTLLSAIRSRYSKEAVREKKSLRDWKTATEGNRFIPFVFDQDIKLNLYADSVLSRVIYDGSFEEEELYYYRNYVKKGFVVFDIGTNIGLHALYAAKLVGQAGKVYAFEPVKKTYSRLTENVALNPFNNISCFNLALSDSNGESTIVTSAEGYDAWNSMAGKQAEVTGNTIMETILTQTFDHFLSQHPDIKHIDFIKIDTEGWELNILQGAANYLKNNSPVLMVEYADDILKKFGRKLEDIYDILTSYGFGLYKFDHQQNSFRKIRRDEKFGVANIIASKTKL